jgi:hypothetical protein
VSSPVPHSEEEPDENHNTHTSRRTVASIMQTLSAVVILSGVFMVSSFEKPAGLTSRSKPNVKTQPHGPTTGFDGGSG